MDCGGFINVIKRNGEKGSRFPTVKKCVIGTAIDSDMRLHVKGVASRHCLVYVDDRGRGILESLTSLYPTLKNGFSLRAGKKEILNNWDKITIADRTFEWEYPPASPYYRSYISNGAIHSKESNVPGRKVTLPRTSLPRSPGSSSRIAVVSPVRRESYSVQLKNDKMKKSIPVSKFYRHSLQNSESLQNGKSVSRKSCTPRLVATVSVLESKNEVVHLSSVDLLEKSVSKSAEFITDEPRDCPKFSAKRKSKSMGSNSLLPLKNVKVSSVSETKVRGKSPRKSNPEMFKDVAGTPRKKKKQSLQTTNRNSSQESNKGEVVNCTPRKSTKNTKLKSQTPEVVSIMNSSSTLRNVTTSGTRVMPPKTPKRSVTPLSSKGVKGEKKSAFKSRLKTPVKRILDTPGSIQQQTKRLKMTPSTQGKVRKSIGPKVSKEVKRPLFSDVVKKSTKKKTPVARRSVKPIYVSKVVRTKIKQPVAIPAIVKLGNSTGHAESPETIIIRKKINTPHRLLKESHRNTPLKRKQTPKATDRAVSRKSNHFLDFKVSAIEKISSASSAADSKGSPKKSPRGISSGKGNVPVVSSPASGRTAKGGDKTPPNKSPNRSPQNMLVTPKTAKRKYESGNFGFSSTHSSKRLRRSGISSTPDVFGESPFNVSVYRTPQISQEMFVSPLTTCNSSPHNDTMKLSSSGICDTSKIIPPHSPSRKSTPRKVSVLANNIVPTPKRLSILGTITEIPEHHHPTKSDSKKKVESPRGKAYSEDEANSIVVTKKQSSSPNVRSPRYQSSPVPSKKVSTSPKLKSPKMVNDKVSSPRGKALENASSGIGLLKLSLSPGKKSPRNLTPRTIAFFGKNLPDVNEVNEPRIAKGVKSPKTEVNTRKNNLRTPKQQKSPKNDLTDICGVKKLLKTPKQQKSPKNDLTDIRGVKKLLNTPKQQKSPKNDLSDVRGVKKLLRSPKVQNSPKNDLTDVRGVKKLLSSPKVQKSPKNDLRDVRGVKKLLSSPKVQKSPKNDLTDVYGVKKLMETPRKSDSHVTDFESVEELLEGIRSENGKILSPGIQTNVTSPSKGKVTQYSPTAKQGRKRSGVNLEKETQSSTPVSPPKTRRLRNQVRISETHFEEGISKGSPDNSTVNSNSLPSRRGRKKIVDSSPVVASPRARRGRAKAQEASNSVAGSIPSTKSEDSGNHLTSISEHVSTPASPKARRGKTKVEVGTEDKHVSSPRRKGSTVQVASPPSVSTPRTRRGRTKLLEGEEKIVSSPRTRTKGVDVPSDVSKETDKTSPMLPKTRRGRTKTVDSSNITVDSMELNHKKVKKGRVNQSPAVQKGKVSNEMFILTPEAKTLVSEVKFHSPEIVNSPLKTRRGKAKVQGVAKSCEEHLISSPNRKRKANDVQSIASNGNEDSPHLVTTKLRRGRTKTQEVKAADTSPKKVAVRDTLTVISSLPKTRSRRANAPQVSQINEINSVLCSPQKKQTRTKHNEPKTVTFKENSPILLYKSNSPIRPAPKKGSKSKSVEAEIDAAPARATRGRRTNATRDGRGDAVKENTRTTRRRRK